MLTAARYFAKVEEPVQVWSPALMYKKWDSQEKKAQAAERKWLDTYQPRGRVSGEFLYPIPEHVYAPAGGFGNLLKD